MKKNKKNNKNMKMDDLDILERRIGFWLENIDEDIVKDKTNVNYLVGKMAALEEVKDFIGLMRKLKEVDEMKKYYLIVEDREHVKVTEDILKKNNVEFFKRNTETSYDVYMNKELKDRLMSDYEFMCFIKYEVEI